MGKLGWRFWKSWPRKKTKDVRAEREKLGGNLRIVITGLAELCAHERMEIVKREG